MNKIVGISFTAILLLPSFIVVEVFAQAQECNNTDTKETLTKMTVEFSCEGTPDSGLLCSNTEMGLCLLRNDLTDIGGDLRWNIMNKMLCEAD